MAILVVVRWVMLGLDLLWNACAGGICTHGGVYSVARQSEVVINRWHMWRRFRSTDSWLQAVEPICYARDGAKPTVIVTQSKVFRSAGVNTVHPI